jgi:hypothetical protein
MSLIVHCGGRKVGREEVEAVVTPGRQGTHYPIPHLKVYDLAVANLKRQGFSVKNEEFALRNGNKDPDGKYLTDAQFFGLVELQNGVNHPDYSLIAGIRNSHDKSMVAGLALGSRVFVCDNMAFSGEVRFGRKHTRFINRDLPFLVHDAMGRIKVLRANQEKRIEAYKDTKVSDNWARCAIMRAAEEDYISWSKCGKVWGEWHEPSHDEFKERNAWSLFNSFTEVMKSYSVQDLPKRTAGVHDLFDKGIGVQLQEVAA